MEGVTIATVDTSGEEVSSLDVAAGIAVPLVFTALFVMSIFITSGYLLQSVTEEKENRVVEIVLSSASRRCRSWPARSWAWARPG